MIEFLEETHHCLFLASVGVVGECGQRQKGGGGERQVSVAGAEKTKLSTVTHGTGEGSGVRP